jgi:hypothetical protein
MGIFTLPFSNHGLWIYTTKNVTIFHVDRMHSGQPPSWDVENKTSCIFRLLTRIRLHGGQDAEMPGVPEERVQEGRGEEGQDNR